MNDLYRRLTVLGAELKRSGRLLLLGLFEREDAPGRWDLLVCSDALAPTLQDTRAVVNRAKEILTPEQYALLAHVVLFNADDEFLRPLAGLRVADGVAEIRGILDVHGYLEAGDGYTVLRDCVLNGVPFRQVVLFEVNMPATVEAGQAA
jgi:hypothetical protein